MLAAALPAAAQCPSDAWQLFAATGDVAEIAVRGSVAWVAAKGGVVRIDLATLGQQVPTQVKITDEGGLISTDVTCMGMDGFGNAYIGTRLTGISVFDPSGAHLADLSSFDEFVWSDLIVDIEAVGDTTRTYVGEDEDGNARTIRGDRIIVSSVDSYSPQGVLEGGGLKSFLVERTAEGGFAFLRDPATRIGINIQRAREIFPEPGMIWIGTSGAGMWRRDETVDPPVSSVALNVGDGLLSGTVTQILRAPALDLSGSLVLWIGTGAGLQTWDGSTVTNASFFDGHNILDVFRDGTDLYVLSETQPTPGTFDRDLWRADLTQPFAPVRVPRATCLADTLYVPRAVAVDASGRVALGTREDSFAILESGVWRCPPSLGPHSPTIADLGLSPDGTLFFGTGDKNRVARANGLGWKAGTNWLSVTPGENPEVLNVNTTEVEVWPDSTVWFGSTVDANSGGLNRLFPSSGFVDKYHPNVVDPSRITLGRNIWDLQLDSASNLWVAYGQNQGGLTVIEYPGLRITNFPFGTIFSGTTSLLRSIDFDSRGRVWASTSFGGIDRAQLYVVDPAGTLPNLSDDRYHAFDVANDIADIAPIPFLAIDSSDRIWLAGEKGLVLGQIGPDAGGLPGASWQFINPSAGQLGGRNPLPYTVGALDWDENLWLGTEAAGLVRISNDLATWTWFDELVGCPLPDQSVTGVYIDPVARRVYVGTATGGIAIVDMNESGGPVLGGDLDPRPFPNPWRPNEVGVLALSGIPPEDTVSIRIFNLAGEVVYEATDVRGAKTWDGRNVGRQLVESGLYLVTAESDDGKVYEGKVAVVR
jgi:hypothetical protein